MSVTIAGMKLPEPARFARLVPLVAVFLLCSGALFYLHQLTYPSVGYKASTTGMVQNASRGDASAPTDENTPGGSYMVFALEETENESKYPANAEYLTALLLTVFLGAILGLMFGECRAWSRSRVSLLAGRRLPSVTCSPPRGSTTALFSVFLL